MVITNAQTKGSVPLQLWSLHLFLLFIRRQMVLSDVLDLNNLPLTRFFFFIHRPRNTLVFYLLGFSIITAEYRRTKVVWKRFSCGGAGILWRCHGFGEDWTRITRSKGEWGHVLLNLAFLTCIHLVFNTLLLYTRISHLIIKSATK